MRPARQRDPIATHVLLRAGATARADLAERVLSAADVADAARSMLLWLGQYCEVERSLCALVTEDGCRLEGVAGDGIPHAEIEAFAVSQDEVDQPLNLALASQEPVFFRPSVRSRRRYPASPFGVAPFLAIPLRRPEVASSLGLLLISGLEAPPKPELDWAVQVLTAKILCLRYESARRNEQRAQRQRELLRSMVDAVSDPILVTNAGGQILETNSHSERLFTAADEESEGRHRAVSLNNMLFSAAAFTESSHGGPGRREVLLVDPSTGEDLLFELIHSSASLPDEASGAVSVLRNVTDLREATREIKENYRRVQRAEAEARAERDRLDLILNSLVDPVVVTDPGGSILIMNPPAERIFNAPPNLDRETSERRIRTNHTVFSSFVSNFYAAQSIRSRDEISLHDPYTGGALPMEAISGKVIDQRGAVTAVVTILHDRREAIEKARLYEQVKSHSEELEQKVQEATVELVRQNEQLRRQKIQLEEASRLKSQFLANVSHELRTPLHAIIGYTELLMRQFDGGPQQTEKLRRVDSNANHLLKIINDLLDIARIESGKMPLEVSTFELRDLVAEILQEMEPVIARTTLKVTQDVPASLPALTSDRKKLKQILLNLLANALKFTPEGFVRIDAEASAEGEIVSVSVADTGIGIDVHGLKKIFDDFSQLESAVVRPQGGTGLGLAICRRLADSLGGRITVLSKIGLGSTFTVTIPSSFGDRE